MVDWLHSSFAERIKLGGGEMTMANDNDISKPSAPPGSALLSSARTYFFGVINPQSRGHYLYDKNGQQVWSMREQNSIPFQYTILDGGLLPPGMPEEQGRLHLAVINAWTVMGMWDRTADPRGKCNASFIAEGIYTLDEMKAIAARDFPSQWARVHQN